MAKKNIVVSDLNGEEVTEENAASLRITFTNSDEVRTLDITRAEADELFGQVGVVSKKRGRKAADATAAATDGAAAPAETPETPEAPPAAKTAPAAKQAAKR